MSSWHVRRDWSPLLLHRALCLASTLSTVFMAERCVLECLCPTHSHWASCNNHSYQQAGVREACSRDSSAFFAFTNFYHDTSHCMICFSLISLTLKSLIWTHFLLELWLRRMRTLFISGLMIWSLALFQTTRWRYLSKNGSCSLVFKVELLSKWFTKLGRSCKCSSFAMQAPSSLSLLQYSPILDSCTVTSSYCLRSIIHLFNSVSDPAELVSVGPDALQCTFVFSLLEQNRYACKVGRRGQLCLWLNLTIHTPTHVLAAPIRRKLFIYNRFVQLS